MTREGGGVSIDPFQQNRYILIKNPEEGGENMFRLTKARPVALSSLCLKEMLLKYIQSPRIKIRSQVLH